MGLKAQVEERLDFLTGGNKPKKNVDVMKEISTKLKIDDDEAHVDEKVLKKKTKRNETTESTMNLKDEEEVVETIVKKKKKKKVVVESDDE